MHEAHAIAKLEHLVAQARVELLRQLRQGERVARPARCHRRLGCTADRHRKRRRRGRNGYFILLEGKADQILSIRDFRYARYVMESLDGVRA
jgi:hypothetical protein